MNNNKPVKFIRKNGKVIPIYDKNGIKKEAKKAFEKHGKEKALTFYHQKTSDKTKENIRKGFDIGKKLFGIATAGLTTALVAKHADSMVSKYEERIEAGKTKASLVAGAGVGSGALGISLLLKNIRKKSLSRGKFGAALALSGLGVAAIIGGKKGREKVSKHEKLAKALRKITSEANKYVGGTSVFQDL